MAEEERLRQIERQLHEVDRSNISLRESIEAIRAPLDLIADIQQEQREIRRTADNAAAAAVKSARQATARDARTRSSLKLSAFGALILLLGITFLTFVALIGHVNELLLEQNRNRHSGCVTRNEAVKVQAKRERILAGLTGDPAVAKVHTESAADLERFLIDCEQYREKR